MTYIDQTHLPINKKYYSKINNYVCSYYLTNVRSNCIVKPKQNLFRNKYYQLPKFPSKL